MSAATSHGQLLCCQRRGASRPHRAASRALRRWSRRRGVGCCAELAPVSSDALAVLLSTPPDLHAATPAVQAAVQSVVREQPSAARSVTDVLTAADGRFEVLYAPHIRALAAPFGMTIRPLRYEISSSGSRIRSDVKYSSAVFGSGWFCAEGRVARRDDEPSAVDVLFDHFWLSTEAEPGANPLTSGAPVSWTDALTQRVGQLFFFPQLSRFPVTYADAGVRLVVFEFPPLSTTIAARRV